MNLLLFSNKKSIPSDFSNVVKNYSDEPTLAGKYADVFYNIHSLRHINHTYKGNCVRLRRNGGVEQNFGFKSGEVDKQGILDWLYNGRYISDFSSGIDGFTSVSGTSSGNNDDIFGENDVYKFYADGTENEHGFVKTLSQEIGTIYKLRFRYYLPSTNSNASSFDIRSTGSGYTRISGDDNTGISTKDQWVQFESICSFTGVNSLRFRLRSALGLTFTGAGDSNDDILYMKDFEFEVLTPAIVTLFDQSGNTRTLTQSTTDNQPLLDTDTWRMHFNNSNKHFLRSITSIEFNTSRKVTSFNNFELTSSTNTNRSIWSFGNSAFPNNSTYRHYYLQSANHVYTLTRRDDGAGTDIIIKNPAVLERVTSSFIDNGTNLKLRYNNDALFEGSFSAYNSFTVNRFGIGVRASSSLGNGFVGFIDENINSFKEFSEADLLLLHNNLKSYYQ